MNWASIKAWLQQPTTAIGFSTLLGIAGAVASGQLHLAAAAAPAAAAFVAIIWPGQKALPADMSAAITALLPVIKDFIDKQGEAQTSAPSEEKK